MAPVPNNRVRTNSRYLMTHNMYMYTCLPSSCVPWCTWEILHREIGPLLWYDSCPPEESRTYQYRCESWKAHHHLRSNLGLKCLLRECFIVSTVKRIKRRHCSHVPPAAAARQSRWTLHTESPDVVAHQQGYHQDKCWPHLIFNLSDLALPFLTFVCCNRCLVSVCWHDDYYTSNKFQILN